MNVSVPSQPGFVYPDLSAVCGEPQFHDAARDVPVNPRVLIEVLSETTERFDRGDKRIGLRSVASVQHVALVSRHERRVEVFTRDGDRWILENTIDGAVAQLRSIGCELPLSGVCRGVPPDPQ